MSIRTVSLRLYWLSTVYFLFYNIVEGRPTNEQGQGERSVDYLKQYGWLKEQTAGGLSQGAQDLSKSLKAFQRFAGLDETGKLDNKTVELMMKPRCGGKDPVDNSRRKRRYKLQGSKWQKKDLTYQIVNEPYDGPTSREAMPPELVLKTVKAAFQKWSHATQLTFTEKKDGEADIMIKFIRGNHNDGYAFDGRGGSLAHAFYPHSNRGIDGDAHFDMDEKFSLTEPDSTNFIWVTTHEFGHSLGLDHSSVKGAVMFPWYTSGKLGNVNLEKDDRIAIQNLYGKPTGKKLDKKIVLPEPPRPECKSGFDAIFHDKHRKKVFAIKDYDYYILNQNGRSKGPKRIEEHWKKLKLKVKAAYTRNDGRTVFFTHYRYSIYHGTRLVEGPEFISGYGLPPTLYEMDAAVVFGGNDETYFFKGDKYWKYNEEERRIYPGYPKLITKYWRGLPENIDSALQTPDGETYFFKGAQFYKFHHYSFSVLPSYPKPIGPYWLGCSEEQSETNLLAHNGGKNSSMKSRASCLALIIAVIWIMLFN